ncbi:MAG: UTP--glucose-1-phosphate uridylyltransferase GalU [Chloroflexota bacterium]
MSAVRCAVIPAAGLGTRMLPATKAVPKEMIPIVDKPVIQYVVEEAVASGIDHIVIVTSAAKRAIEDHFDYFFEMDQRLRGAGKSVEADRLRAIADMASFTFVRQAEPLGNGHAVLCARKVVGDQPFAVLWGDDIVMGDPPCTRQLIDVYEQYGASVCAVMEVPDSDVSKYGVIDGVPVSDGTYKVTRLIEKPTREQAPSRLAAVKGYVLTPETFEILEETPVGQGGEIWLADALNVLAERGRLYARAFTGQRYDAGNQLEILKATVDVALAREGLGDALREHLRQAICS